MMASRPVLSSGWWEHLKTSKSVILMSCLMEKYNCRF